MHLHFQDVACVGECIHLLSGLRLRSSKIQHSASAVTRRQMRVFCFSKVDFCAAQTARIFFCSSSCKCMHAKNKEGVLKCSISFVNLTSVCSHAALRRSFRCRVLPRCVDRLQQTGSELFAGWVRMFKEEPPCLDQAASANESVCHR